MWRVVIADVEGPVSGIDFLSHYNLLVNPRIRLLDTVTHMSAKDQVIANGVIKSIRTIVDDTPFHRLLSRYPALTRPVVFGKGTSKHQVEHYIDTTSGPSVCCKTRRLAPDRYKAAKDEIEFMLQQDIIRPSKNP